MGGQIVLHSFRLVFRNLSDALKVSLGPYLIGLAIAALLMGMAGVSPGTLLTEGMGSVTGGTDASPAQAFAGLGVALVLLFVSSWVAVAWHRFVLLEEYPGMLPALSGRPVWRYIGKAILLGLILIVAMIPVMVVVGLVMGPMVGAPGATPGPMFFVTGLIVSILVGTFLTWLSIRLGLVLPATALGREMRFRESWSTSAPLSGAILTAILILVVLNIVVSALLGLLFGGTVIFGLLDLVVNWISVMVGLSILTTVYGHAAEGRSID